MNKKSLKLAKKVADFDCWGLRCKDCVFDTNKNVMTLNDGYKTTCVSLFAAHLVEKRDEKRK